MVQNEVHILKKNKCYVTHYYAINIRTHNRIQIGRQTDPRRAQPKPVRHRYELAKMKLNSCRSFALKSQKNSLNFRHFGKQNLLITITVSMTLFQR